MTHWQECPTCGRDFNVDMWGWNDETAEAWRLAKAAPDLLAACEAALEIIGVYDEGVGLTLEERMLERTILVAIAKARGGDR